MSISVAPVMEFIRESDEIQIDFHTKMYIVKECFDILGEALTEVVKAVHAGQQPTRSQRTSIMLFTSKPGKTNSLKPEDKSSMKGLFLPHWVPGAG